MCILVVLSIPPPPFRLPGLNVVTGKLINRNSSAKEAPEAFASINIMSGSQYSFCSTAISFSSGKFQRPFLASNKIKCCSPFSFGSNTPQVVIAE